MITKHSKDINWLRNVIGVSQKHIDACIKEMGKPVFYVYDTYSEATGKDDVRVRYFNKPLPVEVIEKKFKDRAFPEVCEVIV